ncbi:SRPBCC family protein [Natronomonas sp. EA1]|uniref:SRPBCC family protein n=1 Tax=Natronomonas sp. EA1 TaxID=3421655 RepID=UPI003EBED194
MPRGLLAGPTVEVERDVNAPRDVLWEVLTDTATWPDWGPSVRAVDVVDRYVAPGDTGRIRTPLGWIPFEIESCGDYCWSWSVAGVPATGHRADHREGGSRVVFEVPVWAVGYAPVCARAARQVARLAESRARGREKGDVQDGSSGR